MWLAYVLLEYGAWVWGVSLVLFFSLAVLAAQRLLRRVVSQKNPEVLLPLYDSCPPLQGSLEQFQNCEVTLRGSLQHPTRKSVTTKLAYRWITKELEWHQGEGEGQGEGFSLLIPSSYAPDGRETEVFLASELVVKQGTKERWSFRKGDPEAPKEADFCAHKTLSRGDEIIARGRLVLGASTEGEGYREAAKRFILEPFDPVLNDKMPVVSPKKPSVSISLGMKLLVGLLSVYVGHFLYAMTCNMAEASATVTPPMTETRVGPQLGCLDDPPYLTAAFAATNPLNDESLQRSQDLLENACDKDSKLAHSLLARYVSDGDCTEAKSLWESLGTFLPSEDKALVDNCQPSASWISWLLL